MNYEKIRATNWSTLSLFATSAYLFRWRQEHPRPDKPWLTMGTMVHCATLEPERYEIENAEYDATHISRPPGLDLRKTEGKEWKASIPDGVEVMTAAEQSAIEKLRRTVSECKKSILNNTDAARLLERCDLREHTIEWELDGTPCKARVDAMCSDTIIELKTTRSLAGFQRDAARYLYHGQLAWYHDGAIAAGKLTPEAKTYIVAAETVEPYDSAVFLVPPGVLDVGRDLYRDLLGYWRECERTGIWPGQFPGIETLTLPRWAQGSEEI